MDQGILTAKQVLHLTGSEDSFTAVINAADVTIKCAAGGHQHGSSRVKVSNLVDYCWEQKHYQGRLLAVHSSGKTFAYAIKAKGGGMVRVSSLETGQRALIKENIRGQVEDLAFAHINSSVMLGCVDEEGSLQVHEVQENQDGSISLRLVVHAVANASRGPHRVVWCPFMPEDETETEEDASRLVLVTRGRKADLLNLATCCGRSKVLLEELALENGRLQIEEHRQAITDAAISPDGTTAATACEDGYVKFFQIYMHGEERPRCLHEWQPHGGQPLSLLAFLDNHCGVSSGGGGCVGGGGGIGLGLQEEQFWKFAVTGASDNSELTIWSCESWSAMQTIRFSNGPERPRLQARLDPAARHLLLSDVDNRTLYVLRLRRDATAAFASSVSEFRLQAPFLGLAVLDSPTGKCGDDDDDDEDDENEPPSMRLLVVQPKHLQECTLSLSKEAEAQLTVRPFDETASRRPPGPTSGGSSPSREVQQILALNGGVRDEDEEFDSSPAATVLLLSELLRAQRESAEQVRRLREELAEMRSRRPSFEFELERAVEAAVRREADQLRLSLQDELVRCASSKAVAEALRPAVEQCYREVVAARLVPSWERVCSSMFQQIQEAFAQGTREYLQSVEGNADKQRRTYDRLREQATQLQQLVEPLRGAIAQMTRLPEELSAARAAADARLGETIAAALRQRPRAETPQAAAVADARQIQQLLAQGRVDAAFQQALSAADLSLVVYICERLDPQQLFAQTPCPLPQPVLLSLVQQLGADMTTHTELKQRYLEEAVLNLDPHDPLTKEHLAAVLADLQSHLAAFAAANPSTKAGRNSKILLLATRSLLKN